MLYLMPFSRKTTIASILFFFLTVTPASAMMNELRVWRTIVVDKDLPFSQQVLESGVCYEVRDTIDLGGGSVDMPLDCKLSFAGGMLSNGSINGNGCLIGNSGVNTIFGRQFVISDVSNKEVSLGWYDLPEDLDASGIIGGLIKNPAVEVLNLAGRTLRMTCVTETAAVSVKRSVISFTA